MTQDYESYVERREAALKERKWDKADFTMCPRKHLRPANKIAPWDKEDTCRCCGVPVLYDSRDSEGRPHLCPPCVEYIIKSGSYQQLKSFRQLKGKSLVSSLSEISRVLVIRLAITSMSIIRRAWEFRPLTDLSDKGSLL